MSSPASSFSLFPLKRQQGGVGGWPSAASSLNLTGYTLTLSTINQIPLTSSSDDQGEAEQSVCWNWDLVERPKTPQDAQVLPLQEPWFCISSEGTQALLQLEGLSVSQM